MGHNDIAFCAILYWLLVISSKYN